MQCSDIFLNEKNNKMYTLCNHNKN